MRYPLLLPGHNISADEQARLHLAELVKDLVPFVLHLAVDGEHAGAFH